VWALDLASFESIREFGKRAATLEGLDAVILNAAIFNPEKVMTPEGWEMSQCAQNLSLWDMMLRNLQQSK